MKKIIYLLVLIIPLIISLTASASPTVSFIATSVESKTILVPAMNSEVTHYRWSIIGKKDAYNSETEWIPYIDRADHISVLETGSYFVTITGKNETTGLTCSFTNQVKVHVTEEYVKPLKKEETDTGIKSLIIHNMPEPFRSFFSDRTDFELLLIILGTMLLIGITTRRKKVKKYVKLEKVENNG